MKATIQIEIENIENASRILALAKVIDGLADDDYVLHDIIVSSTNILLGAIIDQWMEAMEDEAALRFARILERHHKDMLPIIANTNMYPPPK